MHSAVVKGTDTEEIRNRFLETRAETERLCEPLETEDYIPQPTVDVSPAKWNIAHTTWFFEEMILRENLKGYKLFDPSFGFLFNSYYNTIGERTDRHKRGDLSRPTVVEVFEYRRHVEASMEKFFAGGPGEELLALVELGINHEQQHQELFLTDLKYTFSLNPLDIVYREGFCPSENGPRDANGITSLASGIYEIGHIGDGFCFDNELARHKVYLDDFSISKDLVRNRDFVNFIKDGGYEDHRLWHSEGWDWVKGNKIDSPLYWRLEDDGSYSSYTLSGRRELNLESPVCHISFYEASAFAEWSGKRLPTEFEWEAASSNFEWGSRWEWTASSYEPYPGFELADGAVGEYNGKFMVNQKVLRGASSVTPKGHSRNTYRNFFHPNLRWQFTGIRLAE